jgi:hypothetical protein
VASTGLEPVQCENEVAASGGDGCGAGLTADWPVVCVQIYQRKKLEAAADLVDYRKKLLKTRKDREKEGVSAAGQCENHIRLVWCAGRSELHRSDSDDSLPDLLETL